MLAVPGVDQAAGAYETMGAAIVDGKAVETGGAPTLLTTDQGEPFNQATLVAGREIQGRNEVSIIKSFADKAGLEPGDTFTVAAPAGLQEVKVAGVFEWGDSVSLGGTIVIAGRLQDAQRWGGDPGRVSVISVSADPGVTPEELAADVKTAMPTGVSVKTGRAGDHRQDRPDHRRDRLVPHAGAPGVRRRVRLRRRLHHLQRLQHHRRPAAPRVRHAARPRRQPSPGAAPSVIAEALTLGVLASAVGIVAGLGVAKAINVLFRLVGADIPTSGIALEPRTVLIAVLVGVGRDPAFGAHPGSARHARPAGRGPAGGRGAAADRFTRFATAIALLIAALGGGALAWGMMSDGSTNGRMLFMGLGALLLFVAIAMLAKYIVKPASRVIGWPLEKLAPTSGRLARDNAGRNPSRTAATAAALMIGLAMVVFVAVFAQGLKGSFSGSITNSTRADLVAQDRSAYLTVPQKTVAELQQLPGVEAAAGVAWAPLKVKGGGVITANGVDPTVWTEVWGPDWRRGGNDALYAKLDASHVILEDGSPIAAKVKAGDAITVTSQSGKTTELTVLGFYRDQMAYAGMMVSLDTLKKLDVPTAAGMMLVRTDGSDSVQPAVQEALAEFPTQKVETKAEYLDAVSKLVDQILTMFYGLLAMSVIISIFGIVNTLVLSVHERTREIGMLRAIGATRRQVRQMVRYESVITAVIGGVLGTAVGIAFGYVVVTQLGGDGLVSVRCPGCSSECSWCWQRSSESSPRCCRRVAPPTRGSWRPSSTSDPIGRDPDDRTANGPGRHSRPGPLVVSTIGCAARARSPPRRALPSVTRLL